MCDVSQVSHEMAEKMGGGGGAFLPNFQESLFLAWNYTMETTFVPNVSQKVLSVTRLMRYRHINIIS